MSLNTERRSHAMGGTGPNTKPVTPGCSGFTLLEIIIATGLASLLLLAVYTTYFSINRSIDAASEEQEILETGRILMELIKQDIRSIKATGNIVFISKIDFIEDEPVHRIDFITMSSMGSNVFGASVVGYFLIKNEEGERVFVRRESKDVRDDPTEGGTNFELSKLVTKFKLNFFNGEDWVDDWNSKASGKLPKQVRVTINVSDAKGNSKEFTTDEAIPCAL